jgi:hypothetical protein
LFFAVGVVLLLGAGVFAQTSSIDVTGDVEQFVKDVASRKGIAEDKIISVSQVDFNDLPEEVNIQNIDDNALAMYRLGIEEGAPVYVITASQTEFKKQLQNFVGKMLLNLGLSGEITNSEFLASASGVQGSEEKGYVMIRDGSVTGMSTSLESLSSIDSAIAEVVIYKNGEPLGFRNAFDLSETGYKSDYDVVDDKIVNFNKGDIISVRVNVPQGAILKDINTLLEITGRE